MSIEEIALEAEERMDKSLALLNDQFRKAMAAPDTIKRFEGEGIDIIGSTPEQAAATLEADVKKYAVLIKERGMKAD